MIAQKHDDYIKNKKTYVFILNVFYKKNNA
jgi:hypothetical protein